MERLFIKVMQQASTPELSYIDEDFGQLEQSSEGYPVTFPALLISTPSVQWSEESPTLQRGQGNIAIKLAIDCYDDTHLGSTTEDKIAERLLFNENIVRSLMRFRYCREVSPLSRTSSNNYSLGGGIKVYETTFKFSIVDILSDKPKATTTPQQTEILQS